MITTISKGARSYLRTLPMHDLSELVSELKRMLIGDVDYPGIGICGNLCYPFGGCTVAALAKDWPYYSGDPHFPVPDPSFEHGDRGAAESAYARVVPRWSGAYGNYRLSLVQFMLDQVNLYLAEVGNV